MGIAHLILKQLGKAFITKIGLTAFQLKGKHIFTIFIKFDNCHIFILEIFQFRKISCVKNS